MDSKIRLIIVDDNKEICDVLVQFFEMTEDIEVCAVSHTGTDALEKIKNHKPDIVLLDIIMPELDGLAVLEQINSFKEDKPLVIVVSAIGLEKVTNHALSKGASYYIIKPFELVNVLNIIYMLCDSKDSPISTPQNIDIDPGNKLKLTIRNFLMKSAIPTNMLGYNYLFESIMFAVEHNGSFSITKDIYEKVAENNNSTPQCVERAMRNVIKAAFNDQKESFANCFESSKRPSNSEFITAASEKIKIMLNL